MRYREIGCVCSGDFTEQKMMTPYAWRSGQFIHRYYSLMTLVIIVLCACIFCIALALNR